MPNYICPKCKNRSVDLDAREGFSSEAPSCRRCGFGFLFELMEDYYPGPNTGFVVCDQQGRVLATGKGVFELTGYREEGRAAACRSAWSRTSSPPWTPTAGSW